MKEDPLAAPKTLTVEEAPNNEEERPLVDINVQPPPYQKVHRDHDDEKNCRICLEDDIPEQMIAPCKCKGGSKWVHRDCLDEWRLNERDRAFSKCTECLFQYHMQPLHLNQDDWRRKVKFYMMVSRDFCFLTFISQIVIAFLGGFVALLDPKQSIPFVINDGKHPMAAYYLSGWFVFLVVLGMYGSVTLCMNGCDPSKALGNHHQERQPDDSATYSSRHAEYYSHRRHRRHHNTCCDGGHGPYYYPIYVDDGGSTCDCCCTCCCSGGHTRNSSGDCHCDCCPSGGSGSSDGGDAVHVLMVLLLVVAVIMAVIGFFVGLIITVVICQRIVQRHVYLLHKRQLVQEFQVMDLAGYNLECEHAASAPSSYYDVEHQQEHVTPTAPPDNLREKDISYLEKLGLMEEK